MATAASTLARLAVGSNGQVPNADSTQTTGWKWVTPAGAGVTSFAKNGSTPLTGAVTISPGSGVTLTQVGQDVAISSSASGSGSDDGWLDDTGETWTYASGSGGGVATFTVSGDQTSKYTVGTRIKLTQTTVKYFVCAGSTYSSPNTTVTIQAGSSYTLANAAISANYHSYEVNPQGWPNWFAFTPVLTGFSATGTVIFNWNVTGRVCHCVVFLDGTSNATGFTATLPFAGGAAVTAGVRAAAVVQNAGTTQAALGVFRILSTATSVEVFRDATEAAAGWTATGNKRGYGEIFYGI